MRYQLVSGGLLPRENLHVTLYKVVSEASGRSPGNSNLVFCPFPHKSCLSGTLSVYSDASLEGGGGFKGGPGERLLTIAVTYIVHLTM